MGIRVTTEPAIEPVTLSEAKLHLRIDDTTDDDMVENLIKSARRSAEIETNRSFITQTVALTLANWQSIIELPRSRVQSVTSVKYFDTAGNQNTVDASNYQVDLSVDPGRLAPVYGYTWPTIEPRTFEAVEIIYQAGYGDATTDVEEEIRQAILMLVTHLYENRSAVVCEGSPTVMPLGVQRMLTHHRVPYSM